MTSLCLVATGFLIGRAYGTFDVYLRSQSGDYLWVPPLHFAGIFDLGTVLADYPGGLVIGAYQPKAGDSRPPADLVYLFDAGALHIDCHQHDPGTTSVLLTSPYNQAVRDRLTLISRGKRFVVPVRSNGASLSLSGEAAINFVEILSSATFPTHVAVGADPFGRGLYDLPTFGTQNVSASVSRDGHGPQHIVEPPSNPFAVIRRLCFE